MSWAAGPRGRVGTKPFPQRQIAAPLPIAVTDQMQVRDPVGPVLNCQQHAAFAAPVPAEPHTTSWRYGTRHSHTQDDQRMWGSLRRIVHGCVFCSIVAGTAPAERVHEDDFVVAIMDIHPAATGHILVIPKTHSQGLWDIDLQDAEQAMAASVRVAGMMRRSLGPAGINLIHATGAVAWQTVFHFHLHLVPRNEGDRLTPPWPLNQPRAEDASLRTVAQTIRSASKDTPGRS